MKGGKRPGAGRPALTEDQKKVAISILLPRDLLAELDAMPGSRAKLIEKACRAYYAGLNQPSELKRPR
jgi:metal-responsive CopG/Arc/MetJ family transcriptional regulator